MAKQRQDEQAAPSLPAPDLRLLKEISPSVPAAPLPDFRLIKELPKPSALPTPAPFQFSPPSPQQYSVKPGDNLWNISKGLTGNGADFPALYQENKGVIGPNPNLIYPNQVLNIPPALTPKLPSLTPPVLSKKLFPNLPGPTAPNIFADFGKNLKPKENNHIVQANETYLGEPYEWDNPSLRILKEVPPVAPVVPQVPKLGPNSELRPHDPTVLENVESFLTGIGKAFKSGGENNLLINKMADILGPKPDQVVGGPVPLPKPYVPQNTAEKIASFVGDQAAELPLWLLADAAAAKGISLAGKGLTKLAPQLPTLASKVPNLLPKLGENAVRGASTAALGSLGESALAGDNTQQTLNRLGTFVSAGAIGGPVLTLGGEALGKVIGMVNKGLLPTLKSETPNLIPNPLPKLDQPLKPSITLPQPKPFGPLKVVTPEQRALNDLQNGMETVKNYLGHYDVLAPYPPETTLPQAFADIKAKTGVDLPGLTAQLDQALAKPQALAERFTPERAKLGRAAGVIPGPKDTRLLWPELNTNNAAAALSSEIPPAGQQLIQSLNREKLGKIPTLTQPNKPLIPSLPVAAKPLDILPKLAPLGNGQKARSFPATLGQSPLATPELTNRLAAEAIPGGRGAYNPITLEGVNTQAQRMVSNSPEQAYNYVLNSKQPDAVHTATGIRLIEHYQNAGDFERAVDVSMHLADALTKHGQAISAARLVGQLSPEGVLTFAARQVQKINNSKLFKLFGKDAELTPEVAQNLKSLAEAVQSAPDEVTRIEASQELQSALNALRTPGIGQKIGSTQTIAQLYNLKTQGRNVFGNELFYRLERLNKYPAALIDWTRSKITGADRSVTFRTAVQNGYWEGFLKGAKAGWKGVNVNGLETQFDLGRGLTFNPKGNPAEKVMSFLERSLGATMKGFDYAAYNRAYNQTLGEMATLKAINTVGKADKAVIERYMGQIDDNMRNLADQYGKYITFQDNNLISRGLSGIKRGLNAPTGGNFGLGDLILKYPRTPGALIARGLDYSMAGFARSAYLLAKPLMGKQIDNREVMLALSRAITGTVGLTGMGTFLADVGVLTGDSPSDYDITNMQRQIGSGPFKVNLTALKRFVYSGFNRQQAQPQQGDTLINYDWLQPIAFSISMGANIDQNIREKATTEKTALSIPAAMATGLEGATNTVAEQPVLQGLTGLFQGGGLGGALKKTAEGIPSSFAPSLLNQMKQATDNTTRVTTAPSPISTAFNRAQAKLPLLAGNLPPAYDTFGKQKETYQNGSNTPFNVFLNPAFVSQYQPSREAQMVLDIFKNTGETKQAPRTPYSYFTVSGQRFDMTPAELSKFQKVAGETTLQGFGSISNSLTPDNQVKALLRALDHAAAEGKAAILRDRKVLYRRTGDTISIPSLTPSKR